MDFLVALDVLLGLSLVYLVFALAVTSINEFVAAALSSRARWLRKGIASLLSPDPKALAEGKADQVLDSPFLSHMGTPGVFKTFRASYVSAWALVQGVLSTAQGFKADAFARVSDIRALAEQLDEKSPIRSILIDLCARANGDLAKFQELLDGWFKSFEDQLTAWYRQKTQYVVVGLSLFVAVTMNVDTIDIARQLSADPAVRNALVTQAMEAAKAEDVQALMQTGKRDKARTAFEEAMAKREAAEKATGCPAPTGDGDATRKCASDSALTVLRQTESEKRDELAVQQKALEQRIKDRADALAASGLMIGWKDGQIGAWLGKLCSGDGLREGLQKLVGLLLSAFALALGAPFWFNALKSVASVRSVGANMLEKKNGAATK
ncbi:MAG: hypothetical protein J0M28_11040 [Thauera sp.]|nr:hypothetical protein [Thauera sp.]